jgi:preprotein translocase subunit SecB
MVPSPLHLEKYFFTKIHVDACQNSCEKAGKGLFTTQVTCMKHKEADRKWMVQLELQQVKEKDDGCPEYSFRVEVVGFYEVREDYPTEKAEMLVRANGPALLYSAARELIATLTGRGPFAAVNLPTVTFIDEAESQSSPLPMAPVSAGAVAKTPDAPKKRVKKIKQ